MAAVGGTPDDRPPLLARAEQWLQADHQSPLRIQYAEALVHDMAARIGELEGVLRDVELVINPRDMGGISLHEWGSRLRVATNQILATLTPPGAAGQE